MNDDPARTARRANVEATLWTLLMLPALGLHVAVELGLITFQVYARYMLTGGILLSLWALRVGCHAKREGAAGRDEQSS